MLHQTESSVMMNKDTKLVSAPQVSLQPEVDHAFKTDVLLILSVKSVMMPEELLSVSNVLLQPTDFWPCLNSDADALKVSMKKLELADPAHQDVLNAQMPQFAKDAPSQPPTTTTEHALAHKATSSLLSH